MPASIDVSTGEASSMMFLYVRNCTLSEDESTMSASRALKGYGADFGDNAEAASLGEYVESDLFARKRAGLGEIVRDGIAMDARRATRALGVLPPLSQNARSRLYALAGIVSNSSA